MDRAFVSARSTDAAMYTETVPTAGAVSGFLGDAVSGRRDQISKSAAKTGATPRENPVGGRVLATRPGREAIVHNRTDSDHF